MAGKPKLTYANVMATIAVFLALGGASLAASNILLKKNVIHSRQIAPGAVHGSDIAKGAVSRHHLRKQLQGEVTYDGPLPVRGTYFGTGKMQLTNGPTPTIGTVTLTIGWSGSKMTSFSVAGYTSGFCDWPTASPTDASYQTFPGGIWDYGASEQGGQNYLTANGTIGGTQALTLIVSSVGFRTNAGLCQSQGPITTSVMNAPQVGARPRVSPYSGRRRFSRTSAPSSSQRSLLGE